MCDYTFSEHRTIGYDMDKKVLELWKSWIDLIRLDLTREEIKENIIEIRKDFVKAIRETVNQLIRGIKKINATKQKEKMAIEQNTISRDWSINFKDKTYFVNLTYSDGQTLALLNRNYWEITDENGEEVCYAFKGEQPELSESETDEIIEFCVKNFLAESFEEGLKEVMEQAKE